MYRAAGKHLLSGPSIHRPNEPNVVVLREKSHRSRIDTSQIEEREPAALLAALSLGAFLLTVLFAVVVNL
ncbi:MAG TPA: hypothetical protein VKB84_12200 [Candidatus Binataceae bacterium]|nr:hypothetical protein [Candidatus Binataceae bacterium]